MNPCAALFLDPIYNMGPHAESDGRWELHAEGGPVLAAVERLFAQAEGSPRIMALATLQLSKLLTQNPALLPCYTEVYLKMLLYGAPMNDNSFPGTALEVGYTAALTAIPYILDP